MIENSSVFNNKIIDCHTHVGVMISGLFSAKYPYVQDMVGLLETIKSNGVDYAISFPMPAFFCSYGLENKVKNRSIISNIFEEIPYRYANYRLLLESHVLSRQKILPFLMFSLNYAVEEQLSLIKEWESKYYIYGLKYYPDSDGIHLEHFIKKGKKIIDYAISKNYPIVIHSSVDSVLGKESFSDPMDIVKIAKDIPELRIAMAHMGHFNADAIKFITRYNLENIYLDVSPFKHICAIRNINKSELALNLPYDNPVQVLKCLLGEFPNNLIWGSDMPFNFTCDLNNKDHNRNYSGFLYKDNMKILGALSKDKILDICSNNTRKFIFGRS